MFSSLKTCRLEARTLRAHHLETPEGVLLFVIDLSLIGEAATIREMQIVGGKL
jgi:hypothetical protein